MKLFAGSKISKSVNTSVKLLACIPLLYTAHASSQSFNQSQGFYSIPYESGTRVSVTNAHDTSTHQGAYDMSGTSGGPYRLVAPAGGWVRFIEDNNTGRGSCDDPNIENNYIWIEHPNGEWTKYSHVDTGTATGDANLKIDQWVDERQFLGFEGDVGCSDGDHLHFEVRIPSSSNPTPSWQTGFISGEYLIPRICGLSDGQFNEGDRFTVSNNPSCNPISQTYGYFWSGSKTGSFDSSLPYSRASNGDLFGAGVSAHITQTSTGKYSVSFPGIGRSGGHIQITNYGSDAKHCKIRGWNDSRSNLTANVDCYNSQGNPVNSLFDFHYISKRGEGAERFAYVWANSPSSSNYTPSLNYQYNSTGLNNTIQRLGVGDYEVRLPSQKRKGSTSSVTAYGSGNEYCKIRSRSANDGDVFVRVNCYNANGQAVDTRFNLLYAKNTSPFGSLSYGYAFADKRSATSEYKASSAYQRTDLAGQSGLQTSNIRVQRTSTGRYTVKIPNMSGTGSSVQITAYGSNNHTCSVLSWGGTPNINVACSNASGAAADTKFFIIYSDDLVATF